MAQYDTKAATIGDITVTVSKKQNAGDKLQAFLEWLSGKLVDPGYGQPEGGRPDNTLPGGGPSGGTKPVDPDRGNRPDQGLPSGGRPGAGPDNTLPGGGPSGGTKPVQPDEGRPDQGLPSGGRPGRPDNTLPGGGGQVDNSLPEFIGENAKEIAKIILKGTLCDPEAQPKR